MENKSAEIDWKEYRDQEISAIAPILKTLGFSLDSEQVHVSGERFLMRAVTTASGRKLILLGRRESDGKRVVIKASRERDGAHEIEHERICRNVLQKIKFAYDIFFSPKEILFKKVGGFTIFVQEFIDQEKAFLDRPLEEQFRLALKAFKAQESAHAATHEHIRLIKKNFGSIDAKGYLKAFQEFNSNISSRLSENKSLGEALKNAHALLEENEETIEQYTGFLTHTDFVPHNIRIIGEDIYLLDHSSLRFGNKYEGWARFLNFMALYNPPLTEALTQYVKDNRTPEESLSLKLMRVYRLGEIIWYYTSTLSKTEGNLNILNKKRIEFWTHVLESTLEDKPVSEEILNDYKRTRDSLRSEEEKKRQIGLH